MKERPRAANAVRGLIGDFGESMTLTGFKVAFSSVNENFDSSYTWSVSDDGKTWTVIGATIAEKKDEQIENANIWDTANPIVTDTVYYYTFDSAVTARYFMIRSSIPDEWTDPIAMVDARAPICVGLYDAATQNGTDKLFETNQTFGSDGRMVA